MKKLFAIVCILGTTIGVAACDTTGQGNVETAPYAKERTAGGEGMQSGRVERTYRRAQTK